MTIMSTTNGGRGGAISHRIDKDNGDEFLDFWPHRNSWIYIGGEIQNQITIRSAPFYSKPNLI